MTIAQAVQLGQTGDAIQEYLDEIRDAVNNPDQFDDKDHQLEYVDLTITMIKKQLTYLTEK